MQFSESWLREFCNPPITTQQLADTLTMAGLEVEDMTTAAPAFSGVVVGEIVSVEQHPDADRLRVCQVHVGLVEHLTIVCGAPNARAGIRIPTAVVGAVLPPSKDGQPLHITVGQLRGVASYGMLCSSVELGIDQDGEGLMELPSDAPVGQDIRQYLDLDDTLLTLKLTPNLAHCLSIQGVARELSAVTGAPLLVQTYPTIAPTHDQTLKVTVQDTGLCGRFSGRVIRGVNTQVHTPAWMVRKLA
ncbi:MAG: phenylalanine--tRNA ligase subunit beta, partial [Burkholderiaceae bacterium]